MKNSHGLKKRIPHLAMWSGLLLALFLVLPLLPYGVEALAQPAETAGKVENPASELWRAVRQRDGVVPGRTQVKATDSGTFINVAGEDWRQYRMVQLIPTSAWVLAGVLLVIVAFRLIRGQIPIESGRSGESILRFTLSQRTIHWFVAITFVLLMLTGLVLLYGRFVLIPVLGANGFGATASLAKTVHDYVGPAFGLGLLAMIFAFIKGNFPSLKTDIMWVLKGGGMFGTHASAGRYNAGEKIWFWIVVAGGLAVVFSGLVLDFPAVAAIVGEGREDKAFFHFIHSISAVALVAASFGHVYMGTIAMEGAMETMKTGYADTNWAKEHHDIWYEEMMGQGGEIDAAKDKDSNQADVSKEQPA